MPGQEPPVVLIVEDKRELADLYTEWLSGTYPVRTAYDGEGALEKLDGSVDVVLLDRRMPDFPGDEVLGRIRERGYGCRVAMVTAVEPDFDIIDMGFDDYLTKPVDHNELGETIERLAARSSYDEGMREYLSLVSKKSVLEAEKDPDELGENDDYARLERAIEDRRHRLDAMVDRFDDRDVRALLRDLSDDGAGPASVDVENC